MFETLYWSSVVNAVSKLPKETLIGAVAAYVVIDMHKRHTQVRMAKIRSENDVEIARLEKEAAELKYKTALLNGDQN